MKHRLTSGLLVALALSALVGAALGADATGRWKVGGSGCYWDANDEGPDQCDPNAPMGRYKIGDEGSCYWDSSDSGPNQCDGSIDVNGMSEGELIVFGNMVQEVQAEGGFAETLPAADVILGNAVEYGYLLPETAGDPYTYYEDYGIPCEWKPVIIEAMAEKIRGLERQRKVAAIALMVELRFSRGLAALLGMFVTECGIEINNLYWEIQRIREMRCY